eukprot:410633_1
MGCCLEGSNDGVNWEKYADDIDYKSNDSLQPLKSVRNINVRTLTDRLIELGEVDFENDTLETLKQRIQDKYGMPPEQQSLCIDIRNKCMNYLREGNNKYSCPSKEMMVLQGVIIEIKSTVPNQKLSAIPNIRNLRDGQELLVILSLR